jgi:hypothetical protein
MFPRLPQQNQDEYQMTEQIIENNLSESEQ